MDDRKLSGPEFSAAALQATIRLAHRLGINGADPQILHTSQRVSIHLHPLDVVAKVVRIANAAAAERLHRELSIVRHLAAAPIVAPAAQLPAGPHFEAGYGITLWRFVSHVPADGDNPEHVRSAAAALGAVHRALADYHGELPSFWIRIEQCRALLGNERALPALSARDRTFLLATHDRLCASLACLPMNFVPIHGDAHLGNAFVTPDGALWNDFDDVCLGPREWDIAWLPDVELARFEPVDREVLSLLRCMRSLCVSVWCWALSDRPEKREAAEYHLGRLRECFSG